MPDREGPSAQGATRRNSARYFDEEQRSHACSERAGWRQNRPVTAPSYRDHAISRDLIHWESQSVTREQSETGLRYQRHVELGTRILLFSRLRSDERAFYFLGPATYVKHEGELPMAITWRLRHALPGDLYASFAAAVA